MSIIKFTNGVQLDQSSVAGISGLDTSNILYSLTPTKTRTTYTATEDCFVSMRNYDWDNGRSIDRRANIDGVTLSSATGDWGYSNFAMLIPLKKGQILNLSTDGGSNGTWCKVFGLKK